MRGLRPLRHNCISWERWSTSSLSSIGTAGHFHFRGVWLCVHAMFDQLHQEALLTLTMVGSKNYRYGHGLSNHHDRNSLRDGSRIREHIKGKF